jgi:hypothetical protein
VDDPLSAASHREEDGWAIAIGLKGKAGCPSPRPQETFTAIDFGFAFSDLAKGTFNTPSL